MSTMEALFEKELITSAPLSVLPTVMAAEIHPGDETRLEEPLFPELITVAMPELLKLSIDFALLPELHGMEYNPPPMLILTAAMLEVVDLLRTHSSAAI
jgi:hypothetical protein